MSYAHKCSHHYCCGTVEVNPLGNNVKADCTEAESNAVRPSGLLGQIAIISPTGVEVLKMGDLKYLGSAIRSNGECRGEVKKRVQAEWFKASFRGDLWQKNSRKSNSEGLHDGSEICSHVWFGQL